MRKDKDYYRGLADAIGADSAEDAFARMQSETVTAVRDESLVTEAMVLGGLGMTKGVDLLDKLESALPAPVIRVLQSQGINMAESEAQTQVEALRPLIGDEAADWLLDQAKETRLAYPGLVLENVQDAIRLRAEGKV
jgi:hypothetical protein